MSELIKNTSMFLTSGDNSGCGLYRTRWPAEMLGKEWNYGFPTRDERINTNQVIQMQRATNEYFLEWIPMAKARGQKIIYDIDDNLFEIPSYNPAFRPYNMTTQKLTKKIIGMCDICTVSTGPLRKYFLEKRVHTDVVVIPNFLHHLPDYREVDNGDKVIIGYHGTTTHSGDFDTKLVFAIDKILEKYKNVYFVCIGYNPLKTLGNPKVIFHEFVETEKFHDKLYDLKFDIGIAPLKDNLFNQAKSCVKFMEYSGCGYVTVASKVAPYANAIKHMETGILIDNEKDWEKNLEYLINDVQARRMMSKNAYEFVNANFTYKNNGSFIDETYTKILEKIL